MNQKPSTNAEVPPPEVQRLWFSTMKREWSSLAILPSHPKGNALKLARALARVGAMQKETPVKLIVAEGTDLSGVSKLLVDMTNHVSQGGLAIVVLDSIISNPAGIPLALAADAALLCVELGEADLDSSKRTLELVGESKFVGAVSFQHA